MGLEKPKHITSKCTFRDSMLSSTPIERMVGKKSGFHLRIFIFSQVFNKRNRVYEAIMMAQFMISKTYK